MTEYGLFLEKQNSLFFFGNKKFTENVFAKNFPNYEFKKNKQVHSNTVIHAKNSPQSADGLWTEDKNTALVSVTADCIPLLLSNGKKAFALHAGWRGVASNIVGSAFETLTDEDRKTFWTICIGPHIQKNSFDIKEDTLKPLMAAWDKVSATGRTSSLALPAEQISEDRWRFNLYSLVMAQLRFYFRDKFEVFHLESDTKQNPLFHSFRRDKENAGRNYSFVVLKD